MFSFLAAVKCLTPVRINKALGNYLGKHCFYVKIAKISPMFVGEIQT